MLKNVVSAYLHAIWRIAALIAAILLFALATAGCSTTDTVVDMETPAPTVSESPVQATPEIVPPAAASTLLLRVNPEIEFMLDKDGMAVGVTGVDEDGARLIEGIDFCGYTFENAAIVVVNRLIEQNYITVADIEKRIVLSVAGENRDGELIRQMSDIISAAAGPYELNVETVQGGDNSLEILLVDAEMPLVDGALPFADPAELPVKMEIEFELTGNINRPEDIGYQGTQNDEFPVFQHGKSEVRDVMFTLEDGESYAASEIVELDTAGDWLSTAVFQVMYSLIEKGYITNDLSGQIVVELPDCKEEQLTSARELTALILEEAGLSLSAEDTGSSDTFIIVRDAATPIAAPSPYTMQELMDTKLNKDISMVSGLQMEILTRAYTYDGAMERLRTRRWAVIPDFVGMEGDAAIALCEMTGFRPKVVYEQFSMGGFPEDEVGVITEAHIGLVIYQDGPAGFAYEVGMPLQLNILTDK